MGGWTQILINVALSMASAYGVARMTGMGWQDALAAALAAAFTNQAGLHQDAPFKKRGGPNA